MLSWKRPDNLGAKNGRLAPCRRSPNCVCSQADSSDAVHSIAPIPFKGTAAEAMSAAKKAIESMERATLVRQERGYVYAEFRSKLLGYVDDVEFFSQGAALHVRSASRLGRRDFGVNRARIEQIRKLLGAKRP